MPQQPIVVQSPLSYLAGTVGPSQVMPVLFTFVFAIWVIYTLVIAYHLVRYSHQSWFAVPLLVGHVFVSGSMLLYMVSGLH